IQSATLMSYARPSAGSPSNCQKAMSDNPSAMTMRPLATVPALFLSNDRIPISPLIAAPRPGSNGINQMYFIVLRQDRRKGRNPSLLAPPAPPAGPGLPSHQIHFVDVDRFLVAIEREDDAEADCSFR